MMLAATSDSALPPGHKAAKDNDQTLRAMRDEMARAKTGWN